MFRWDSISRKNILAANLCAQTDASSLLVMLEGPTDWEQLREHAQDLQIVIAADTVEELAGANRLPGAGPFDPSGMGRAMGGWVLVKGGGADHWQSLAEQALAYVRSLAK